MRDEQRLAKVITDAVIAYERELGKDLLFVHVEKVSVQSAPFIQKFLHLLKGHGLREIQPPEFVLTIAEKGYDSPKAR